MRVEKTATNTSNATVGQPLFAALSEFVVCQERITISFVANAFVNLNVTVELRSYELQMRLARTAVNADSCSEGVGCSMNSFQAFTILLVISTEWLYARLFHMRSTQPATWQAGPPA